MAAKFNGPFYDKTVYPADMSASFFSTPSSMETFDNICYQLQWTGASPLGAITVQVSNNYDPRFPTVAIWTTVEDFGVPIVIHPGGSPGDGVFDLNQLPGQWVRLAYTTAGGSVGTMTSSATMKAV